MEMFEKYVAHDLFDTAFHLINIGNFLFASKLSTWHVVSNFTTHLRFLDDDNNARTLLFTDREHVDIKEKLVSKSQSES